MASHPARAYRRVLKPGGRCVLCGGRTGVILRSVLGGLVPVAGRRFPELLLHQANRGLDELEAAVLAGGVRPVIDRGYRLDQVPDAFRHYASGDFVGKIVVAAQPPTEP